MTSATARNVVAISVFFGILSLASAAHAVVIEFGSTIQNLPYAEDGLSFTKVLANSPMSVTGFGTDMALIAGTNFTPIHVRATGVTPFNLDTLDVEGLARPWRLESSSGAVFNIPSTGTINLAAQPGWQSINYFDIIHNPAEPNGTITVDNVAVTFVPEPTFAGAATGLVLALLAWRRRRLV